MFAAPNDGVTIAGVGELVAPPPRHLPPRRKAGPAGAPTLPDVGVNAPVFRTLLEALALLGGRRELDAVG